MSPDAPNITDEIFSRAQREPRAIAVIDGDRNIEYHALCRGVCLAAQRFQQAGWKAGDIVGISMRESPLPYLVTSLALARMGITQVSLPASDPATLNVRRMREIGVSGLVSNHALATAAPVATVPPDPDWLADPPHATAVDDFRLPGGDRLWIISESSGTTGKAKLIGISHALEDTHGKRQAGIFAHRAGERFLNLTGLRFLIGIKRAIRCLGDGGTLVLPPAGISYDQLLNWCDLHLIAYISCVPLDLHKLLSNVRSNTPRLPSLRILRCSSAALPAAMLNDVRRRISPNVYVGYGLSEVSAIATATPDMLAAHPDTVGRPFEGIELEIVDDTDRPLPPGGIGHVRVRGPGIEATYLHASVQELVRVFRDGWFYPGDIGVKNETGLLFLKGRTDEVMNFDGMLIGPGDIEGVLLEHPAVTEAAAFALPSPEHQDIPAAAIVSGDPLQTEELARFCADRLGVRAPWVFLQVDAIPRNAMGKILRRRLTELALQKLQARGRS